MATRQSAGTRAKDSDRNNTCQVLDSALSDGQLSGAEHRERVAAATTAATLGDLQALVVDLQVANAPVQMPKLRSSKRRTPDAGNLWLGVAKAVVLVLLGIGIGWGLYGNTSSPLSFSAIPGDPGAVPDGVVANTQAPPTQLFSVYGLNGMFDQMRKKFGDTMGYELRIWDDNATVKRDDPQDDRRTMDFDYRGGWSQSLGSPSAKSTDERLVDLAKFDVTAIIARLRGTPQILGIEQRDVDSVHMSIEASPDATAAGAVTIEIYVSTTYGNGGYITVDPQGNILRQSPPSS